MNLLSTLILFFVFIGASVFGQDAVRTQKPKPSGPASLTQKDDGPSTPARSPAERYFSDVELIDQDGRKPRFYRRAFAHYSKSRLLKSLNTKTIIDFLATCGRLQRENVVTLAFLFTASHNSSSCQWTYIAVILRFLPSRSTLASRPSYAATSNFSSVCAQ